MKFSYFSETTKVLQSKWRINIINFQMKSNLQIKGEKACFVVQGGHSLSCQMKINWWYQVCFTAEEKPWQPPDLPDLKGIWLSMLCTTLAWFLWRTCKNYNTLGPGWRYVFRKCSMWSMLKTELTILFLRPQTTSQFVELKAVNKALSLYGSNSMCVFVYFLFLKNRFLGKNLKP